MERQGQYPNSLNLGRLCDFPTNWIWQSTSPGLMKFAASSCYHLECLLSGKPATMQEIWLPWDQNTVRSRTMCRDCGDYDTMGDTETSRRSTEVTDIWIKKPPWKRMLQPQVLHLIQSQPSSSWILDPQNYKQNKMLFLDYQDVRQFVMQQQIIRTLLTEGRGISDTASAIPAKQLTGITDTVV